MKKRHWVNFRGPDILFPKNFQSCQERDKVWEILTAAIVTRFCNETELDEPDIVCTRGGIKWGLACKVFNTNNLKTNVERIMEGVEQIDKADVDAGLIMVNLSGFFEHNLFWKRDDSGGEDVILMYSDRRHALNQFLQMRAGLKSELTETVAREISPISKVLGILGFTQTVCPIANQTKPDAPGKMNITHSDLYFQRKDRGPEEDFALMFRHCTEGVNNYSFNYPETF